MIASYGGAIIDRYGNREFIGSGGAVGGLSAPGRNYSYMLGAGEVYNSFTPKDAGPGYDNNIEPPHGPCPLDTYCPPVDYPPIEPPPPTPTPPGGTTTGGTTLPCVGRSCGGVPTVGGIKDGLSDLITGLLGAGPKAAAGSSGPVYLFTPQPGESTVGGIGMKQLLVLVVIGVAGWFLVKKYA